MEVGGGWREAREVGQPCTEGEGRNEGGEERQGTGAEGKERKEIGKQTGRRGRKAGRKEGGVARGDYSEVCVF